MTTEIQQPEKETVGQLLRRTRLAKKMDLQDIAAYLCIRYRFLEALEEGRTKELPGDAYAHGFVRSYAAYLGLDSGEVVARYKEETSGTADETRDTMTVDEAEAENSAPAPIILIVSLVLLLAGYGVWKGFLVNKPEEAPVVTEPVTVLEESYPLPSEPVVDEPVPVEETVAAGVVTAPVVQEPAPVPPVPPKKPDQPKAVETAPVAAAVAMPEPPVEIVRIYGQKNVNPRLVLVANEPTWIEVSRAGNVLISRVLNKGDRYQVSRNPENLLLKTGNAGGIEIYLDGVMMPAVGPKGTLRSNIPLDPAFFAPKEAMEFEE